MFNKRNIMMAIKSVMAAFNKPIPKNIRDDTYSGVGPKKGVVGLHRDVKRQASSRYPKVHQGKQECARRLL